MSYIILRGRWCHIIVLNVHAPTEDKTDDVKDSNAKVGRKNIFKPTIRNENLYEISNDNGLRVVNFSTSKNL
jgi:hypothetical protein